MTDLYTRQIADDMWALVKSQMKGDQRASKEFDRDMNFLAICGDSLKMPDWNRVAKQLFQDSQTNADLPRVQIHIGSSGEVYKIDFRNEHPSLLEQMNPRYHREVSHRLKWIQPLNNQEACRALSPSKFEFSRSLAPRG